MLRCDKDKLIRHFRTHTQYQRARWLKYGEDPIEHYYSNWFEWKKDPTVELKVMTKEEKLLSAKRSSSTQSKFKSWAADTGKLEQRSPERKQPSRSVKS